MDKEKFVVVKHKKDSIHSFVFKLGKGVKAKVGDVVLCSTKRGYDIGFVSEMVEIPKVIENDFLYRMGAYKPVKEIIFAMPEEIYNKLIDSKRIYFTQLEDSLKNITQQVEELKNQL